MNRLFACIPLRECTHDAYLRSQVLPRQTCGLYTHTIYRDRYPGGVEKLEASIKGGELFETILHNPVNIYMTHMSNYAHDRLALSTFSALIEFVQKYTNLQLKYSPSDNGQLGPNQLAEYYFSLFPHEQRPIWTVSILTTTTDRLSDISANVSRLLGISN